MKLADYAEFNRPIDFRTQRGERLPSQLLKEGSIPKLFGILPPSPHILVGAVGNMLTKGVDILEASHLPKRGDLDLMVLGQILSETDWQKLNAQILQYQQDTTDPQPVTYWDNNQIVIVPGSSVFKTRTGCLYSGNAPS